MSTEYYLVCDKHKHIGHICSDGFSGPMLQCGWEIAGFIVQHSRCDIKIIDEHHLEDCHEDYIDWREVEDWKELMTYE